MKPLQAAASSHPLQAGIGLRAEHYRDFLHSRPPLALVEMHSENCFGGGVHFEVLLRVREFSEVSLHGIGLSLGSTDPLDDAHLRALRALVDAIQPVLVSDHLCWSSVNRLYANDLLPLPYTAEALAHVCNRIERVQEVLGRPILVENVSSYLQFRMSEMPEWEFFDTLARRSGCALLLDVNNVYVSAANHGFDPRAYLHAMRPEAVGEYHLAGHVANPVERADGQLATLLIDTHSRPVAGPVWALFEETVRRLGPRPTVIEWDAELPPLDALVQEARRAERVLLRRAPRERVHHECPA